MEQGLQLGRFRLDQRLGLLDRAAFLAAVVGLGVAQRGAQQAQILAQEFGREANTLCAKANDVSLSRIGLELKSVIEQFREQVQNVE